MFLKQDLPQNNGWMEPVYSEAKCAHLMPGVYIRLVKSRVLSQPGHLLLLQLLVLPFSLLSLLFELFVVPHFLSDSRVSEIIEVSQTCRGSNQTGGVELGQQQPSLSIIEKYWEYFLPKAFDDFVLSIKVQTNKSRHYIWIATLASHATLFEAKLKPTLSYRARPMLPHILKLRDEMTK